mgnify:CR=1 FL=1
MDCDADGTYAARDGMCDGARDGVCGERRVGEDGFGASGTDHGPYTGDGGGPTDLDAHHEHARLDEVLKQCGVEPPSNEETIPTDPLELEAHWRAKIATDAEDGGALLELGQRTFLHPSTFVPTRVGN